MSSVQRSRHNTMVTQGANSRRHNTKSASDNVHKRQHSSQSCDQLEQMLVPSHRQHVYKSADNTQHTLTFIVSPPALQYDNHNK